MAHEYGLTLTPLDALEPADAVIVAVSHAAFVEAGWPMLTGLLKGGSGLVVDIRSCLDRASKPETIALWRV